MNTVKSKYTECWQLNEPKRRTTTKVQRNENWEVLRNGNRRQQLGQKLVKRRQEAEATSGEIMIQMINEVGKEVCGKRRWP